MVVALTVTPALSLMLLANAPLRHRGLRWLHRLRRGYDRMARGWWCETRAAFVAVAAIAAIGLLAVPFLDTSMRPSLKERDVLVHVEAPPGTSLPRITRSPSRPLRISDRCPASSTSAARSGEP